MIINAYPKQTHNLITIKTSLQPKSLIVQNKNSAGSNNQSMKYQRLSQSGCND